MDSKYLLDKCNYKKNCILKIINYDSKLIITIFRVFVKYLNR